jgi:hypothetical protein
VVEWSMKVCRDVKSVSGGFLDGILREYSDTSPEQPQI